MSYTIQQKLELFKPYTIEETREFIKTPGKRYIKHKRNYIVKDVVKNIQLGTFVDKQSAVSFIKSYATRKKCK